MGIDHAGTFDVGEDITVHRMGYGAMRLCGPGVWGDPADRENPGRVLRRCLELGIDLIDTADAYGPEVNEYQIADALHPYPKGLLIATKGGLVRDGPSVWRRSGHPTRLNSRINNSLRRLRLETIDLYQYHAVDPDVPLADSVGALAKAREEGRIRHIGLSNVSVAQLDEATQIVPIATVQNRYNLTDRGSQDVLDRCATLNIGFIPWYPLAAGKLSGEGQQTLSAIAAEHDATTSQVALAWLLQKSPVMLPIPGTSSVAHLEENVAAADITLSDDQMARLDGLA
ncbi:MAG: aldo/keto reductase [Myxococcota bacterium]